VRVPDHKLPPRSILLFRKPDSDQFSSSRAPKLISVPMRGSPPLQSSVHPSDSPLPFALPLFAQTTRSPLILGSLVLNRSFLLVTACVRFERQSCYPSPLVWNFFTADPSFFDLSLPFFFCRDLRTSIGSPSSEIPKQSLIAFIFFFFLVPPGIDHV